MPIRKEDQSRYPSNWAEIRQSILERAGYRCEQCKVKDRSRIARGGGKDVDTYMTDDADVYCADSGQYLGRCRMDGFDVLRMTDIVLTIAHLDHVPENCTPENLRSWCQRCHLRYDAKHHAETSRSTRRDRLAIGDLFGPQTVDDINGRPSNVG